MKTLASAAVDAMTDGTAISVGAVKIDCGPSAFGAIAIASVGAGGSGYAASDTGIITGDSGDATYTVLTVSGGGAVLTFSVTPGTAYKPASGRATTVSTGSGNGAFTVNIESTASGALRSGAALGLDWWQYTAPAASDIGGAFATFTGLSWAMPCGSSSGSNGCYCSDVTSSFTLGGSSGTTYMATFRIRGCIELVTYSGGTAIGTYVVKNATGQSVAGVNTYKLVVSSPAATYYMNNGTFSLSGLTVVDYELTIPVDGGATLTLTALANDGVELINVTNVSAVDDDVTRPIVVTQPYNGQFLQLDILNTAVDRARMGIAFLNAAGAVIDAISWASLIDTPGTWTERSLTANAPGGAYGWRLYQEMAKGSGLSNAGYIDDITATFAGAALTIPNPGAETGDTTGWTIEAGALDIGSAGPSPHAGSYYFTGGTAALTRAYYESLVSAAVRVWGGYGTIALDGEDYLGIGDRGLVTVTGAALGDSEQNVTLSLSGIEPAILALFDATALQRAPCKIWILTFDGSGTAMLDAQVYTIGRLDAVTIDETIGAAATIVAQVETAARGLGRSGQRMRTDADQRLINSGDEGFKAVSFAGQKTLYWGGQRPSSAAGLGYGQSAAASGYGVPPFAGGGGGFF